MTDVAVGVSDYSVPVFREVGEDRVFDDGDRAQEVPGDEEGRRAVPGLRGLGRPAGAVRTPRAAPHGADAPAARPEEKDELPAVPVPRVPVAAPPWRGSVPVARRAGVPAPDASRN